MTTPGTGLKTEYEVFLEGEVRRLRAIILAALARVELVDGGEDCGEAEAILKEGLDPAAQPVPSTQPRPLRHLPRYERDTNLNWVASCVCGYRSLVGYGTLASARRAFRWHVTGAADIAELESRDASGR